MDSENIPAIDKVVDMIRFWVNFTMSPTKALASYEGLGDVSLQLFVLMGAGLMISTFVVYVLGRIGWMSHPAMTKAIFGPIVSKITGAKLQPVALVPAVALFLFFAIVILHAVAVSWVWVDQKIYLLNSNLGGSFFDSLNASAAFLAFFIPLSTICAIAAGVVARAKPQNANLISEIAGTGLGIVILIYLPWALAAVHPDTTYVQVMAALGGWLVGIMLLSFAWIFIRRVYRK